MTYLAVLSFLLTFSTLVYGSSDDLALQTQVITRFYATASRFKEPGVPSKANIEKLRPCISTSLNRLLREMQTAEVTYQKKTRGKSPPLIESYVFYSLFEGAHAVAGVHPEHPAPSVTFVVDLHYVDPYGTHETTKWQDRVYLVLEHGRWVVTDIEFLGEWAFRDHGTLQGVLQEGIKTAQSAPSP